jgi:hypothetical protein
VQPAPAASSSAAVPTSSSATPSPVEPALVSSTEEPQQGKPMLSKFYFCKKFSVIKSIYMAPKIFYSDGFGFYFCLTNCF